MKATGTSKVYFRIRVWLGRSFHDCRSYRKPFDAEGRKFPSSPSRRRNRFLPDSFLARTTELRTSLSLPHSLSEKSNIWCTKGVGADESRVVRVWEISVLPYLIQFHLSNKCSVTWKGEVNFHCLHNIFGISNHMQISIEDPVITSTSVNSLVQPQCIVSNAVCNFGWTFVL